ncbi:MAG: ABC transporter ATP-binding protein [Atopobiaceae bacterium]|nr:ABC transporter ATP-binding protein [Atopobiaceae bacterium]
MAEREELSPKPPLVIRVTDVGKRYRLGEMGGRTLQHELQTWWARRQGKQDPNRRLGDDRAIGEEFWALRNVSLEVRRGERVGIVGVNGAGKSTLLKLLCRITAPTEGRIELWGRVSSMLEVGTGFHREMTGRENIYMNGAILGMTGAQIDERMEQIVEFSEVGQFLDTPVKRYSSGMFVKLAFAVAAHLTSEIMIMDEVLAVGDVAFQRKCIDRMRSAAEDEGRTVLYVSHNMDTIRRLCDRCVVLDAGRVVYDGDVSKGIATYMNNGLGLGTTDVDLAALSHSGLSRGTGVRMERVVLDGKADTTFDAGEDLRLRLWARVERPVRNVCLRVTLRSETDVGLASTWSDPLDLENAGEHELAFCVPLDGLRKGVLYVSLGMYRVDEVGRRLTLDHVSHALRIELAGVALWNLRAYGYMELPKIQVI